MITFSVAPVSLSTVNTCVLSSVTDAAMAALMRQLSEGLHRLAIQPACLRQLHGKHDNGSVASISLSVLLYAPQFCVRFALV